MRRAVRAARRMIARRLGRRAVDFRPDDTVVLLGALWGSRSLPDAVEQARQRTGFRVVSLIYDLIPIEYPHLYDEEFPPRYQHYLDRVLDMSSRLLVISEATRSDLASYAANRGSSLPPTEVVLLGDSVFDSARSVRPEGLLEGDFALAVSTIEPRKNHQVLYRAVKHAQLAGIRLPRIVLVGSPGWKTRDLQYVLRNDPTTQDSFVWLSNATDDELAWLYQHAVMTLYPSVAEGWGLPIAESMHFGKLCLTCGVSSMPEVAGDLAEYLSPYDPAAWAETIAHFAADTGVRSERERRIAEEYVPRSWDAAAAVVRDALVRQ